MTTAHQVARALKPLLARHADLVLEGRLLIVRPVAHMLRGIFVDASSRRDVARPRWVYWPLCHPAEGLSLGWSWHIHVRGFKRSNLDDPAYVEALVGEIEHNHLDKLRDVDKYSKFMATRQPTFPFYPEETLNAYSRVARMAMSAGMGDFETFQRDFEYFDRRRPKPDGDIVYRQEFERLIIGFAPIVFSRDRAAIAAKLHEWEAYSVRNLKIEHLWEKTPFPIELSSGDVA